MSFAKLFAAGRSFIGMPDARSPYRIRPENRLPKFESTKNPFASKNGLKGEGAEKILARNEAMLITPAIKVAPMETFPLFDAELKPVVRNEAPPVRGSVRVVTVSQSRLPQTQVKPGRNDAVLAAAKMGTRMKEATVSGGKVGDASNRAPSLPPGAVEGLMDGSPLGLKTGKPGKNKLPAPVVVPPVAADRPQDQNNTVTVDTAIEHFMNLKAERKTSKTAKSVEPVLSQVISETGNTQPVQVAGLAKSATFGTWLRKLNPFAYLSGRDAERQSARARMPVQTELSLEKVKVIRNDLNDADLEVVRVRKAEKTEKPVPRLESIEPAEATRLGRLTSRFFRTEQVQTH